MSFPKFWEPLLSVPIERKTPKSPYLLALEELQRTTPIFDRIPNRLIRDLPRSPR